MPNAILQHHRHRSYGDNRNTGNHPSVQVPERPTTRHSPRKSTADAGESNETQPRTRGAGRRTENRKSSPKPSSHNNSHRHSYHHRASAGIVGESVSNTTRSRPANERESHGSKPRRYSLRPRDRSPTTENRASTIAKILPRPPRPTGLPKGSPPSASPRSSSELTKPRLDNPPADPSLVKSSAPEVISTTQEESEKTQSKSDDKSPDSTSGKDSVKPSETAKKKFPYEQD